MKPSLVAIGTHVGDGWVLLKGIHPIVSYYFLNGMVFVPAVVECPNGVTVRLGFEKNKNCLKMVDWHIAK